MTNLARVRRVLIYIVVLLLSVIVGYFLAHLLETVFASNSTQSAISILIAAAAIFSTNNLEERFIWGRIFESSKTEIVWIGRNNSLLTGTAPAPVNLGIALGLLLKLML